MIERAMRIGMGALEQLDDFKSASLLFRFGFSHENLERAGRSKRRRRS
jgi:hypothetical protein